MSRKLAVIGIIFLLVIGVSHSTVKAKGPHGPPIYYLSLGTSLAAGIQADPSTGEDIITETSYPRLLADILQETRIPTLAHVNLGCSGETSEELIHGGECVYPHGSQLDQAVNFLHAHRKFTALITIDIGANDVTQCLEGVNVIPGCLPAKLEQLAYNLDYILETLSEVAPDVPIVAMNYYNPYLVYYSEDRDFAALTIMLQMWVNRTLETVFTDYGVPVANVAGAFMSYNLKDYNGNGIPDSVELLCAWTWMCSHQNHHPNESGYAAIAELFYEMLPDLPVWTPPGRRKFNRRIRLRHYRRAFLRNAARPSCLAPRGERDD